MRRRFWDKIGLAFFFLLVLAVIIYVALLVLDIFTVNSPNDHEWLY